MLMLRESAKKVPPQNGQAIKALPPHPLELKGHGKLYLVLKKIFKKLFLLNDPAFTPSPS